MFRDFPTFSRTCIFSLLTFSISELLLNTFDLQMCFDPTPTCIFSTSNGHRIVEKWSEITSFDTFDLEMCFAPQRRALFQSFSRSQLPKVLRDRRVLTLFTSKCAAGHKYVPFFISHLASWLRTRRFSEPTFRPSRATTLGKHSISRLSYFFAHLHLPSSDFLPLSLL